MADFSAEDFAAWQQLNAQWREIQQSDEIIAATVAELDEEEQIRPGLSEDAAEVATEGLCRQVSVAKYDQMLQNPTLAEDKRAQVLAMREKRLARELGSFTEEERAEWEYFSSSASKWQLLMNRLLKCSPSQLPLSAPPKWMLNLVMWSVVS